MKYIYINLKVILSQGIRPVLEHTDLLCLVLKAPSMIGVVFKTYTDGHSLPEVLITRQEAHSGKQKKLSFDHATQGEPLLQSQANDLVLVEKEVGLP